MDRPAPIACEKRLQAPAGRQRTAAHRLGQGMPVGLRMRYLPGITVRSKKGLPVNIVLVHALHVKLAH